MILYFDTETSGKANYRAPFGDASQPHLAQIAAILMDAGEIISSINLYIKRNGWSMSQGATDANGITDKMLDAYGVPLIVALGCFSNMCKLADERVAFNIDFDELVTQTEAIRLGKELSISHMRCHCAMKHSMDRCKIPNPNYRPGRDQYKWPSLEEAFQHEFGYMFEGAHNGMRDTMAVAKLDQWQRFQINLDII